MESVGIVEEILSLPDICEEIIDVEEGLMYGTIAFSYDNLMSATKPGHPMMILDSILAEIYFQSHDSDIDIQKVKSVVKNLKDFKRCFKVKELNTPIKHMEAYIRQRGAES